MSSFAFGVKIGNCHARGRRHFRNVVMPTSHQRVFIFDKCVRWAIITFVALCFDETVTRHDNEIRIPFPIGLNCMISSLVEKHEKKFRAAAQFAPIRVWLFEWQKEFIWKHYIGVDVDGLGKPANLWMTRICKARIFVVALSCLLFSLFKRIVYRGMFTALAKLLVAFEKQQQQQSNGPLRNNILYRDVHRIDVNDKLGTFVLCE